MRFLALLFLLLASPSFAQVPVDNPELLLKDYRAFRPATSLLPGTRFPNICEIRADVGVSLVLELRPPWGVFLVIGNAAYHFENSLRELRFFPVSDLLARGTEEDPEDIAAYDVIDFDLAPPELRGVQRVLDDYLYFRLRQPNHAENLRLYFFSEVLREKGVEIPERIVASPALFSIWQSLRDDGNFRSYNARLAREEISVEIEKAALFELRVERAGLFFQDDFYLKSGGRGKWITSKIKYLLTPSEERIVAWRRKYREQFQEGFRQDRNVKRIQRRVEELRDRIEEENENENPNLAIINDAREQLAEWRKSLEEYREERSQQLKWARRNWMTHDFKLAIKNEEHARAIEIWRLEMLAKIDRAVE